MVRGKVCTSCTLAIHRHVAQGCLACGVTQLLPASLKQIICGSRTAVDAQSGNPMCSLTPLPHTSRF